MREVNFSIPNVNKASVGITTALYDRRALDCTSTLPLINSLNHLAYLTTSSARIRDILTLDGGVERLVCLLKAGRNLDPKELWKWNLAFQCVVNVGVRGSETVRTRIVEADLIPVIATILDNYIKVVDRCREKAEEAMQAQEQRLFASRSLESQNSNKEAVASFGNRAFRPESSRAARRQQPPPSIEIPFTLRSTLSPGSDAMEITPTVPQANISLSSDSANFASNRRHHHHFHHRAQEARLQLSVSSRHNTQPLAAAVPPIDRADSFGIRPVREVDRLPSMIGIHIPQSGSPTTPLPTSQLHSNTVRSSSVSNSALRMRRTIIRHQTLHVVGDDSTNTSDESVDTEISDVSTANIQSPVDINIQEMDMDENDSLITGVESHLGLNHAEASDAQDIRNFNVNHRSALTEDTIDNTTLNTGPALGFMPITDIMGNTQLSIPQSNLPRFLLDWPVPSEVRDAMPREDDILMSLQLLAYVSKYCNLRPYFQKSHLVPKLKIGWALKLLDQEETKSSSNFPYYHSSTHHNHSSLPENEEEEYLLPDDFNIFPLVEKFTVRHHSHDMQYWAGVVMRNLCRKDESRGGIRQCAHYQCGKWEQYTRQFAKCRRCRRTKYCSKECQKSAWIFHRHWCVAVTTQ